MQARRHLLACCLVLALLCAAPLVAIPVRGTSAAAEPLCFTETGYCVGEPFLSYWRDHGGLAINGYPISAVFPQELNDGKTAAVKTYDVQYFERARFELHPEAQDPRYTVLLGQFGRVLYPTLDTGGAQPIAGADYFPETRHNVDGAFRDYWRANGGLAQFGYPLSERLRERLEDGKEYEVQYFERARLEYHPEYAAPNDILLGQFGRRILASLDPNTPVPFAITGGRGALYRDYSYVRAQLLLPTGTERPQAGAIQHFERGKMIWQQDTRTIYVFAFDIDSYEQGGQWRVFDDTWAEGQAPGGGSAPRPNLYYPQRGFGKVWRENPEVQQLLGFALTPDETQIGLTSQPFASGAMIEVTQGPAYNKYRHAMGVYVILNNWRFTHSGGR